MVLGKVESPEPLEEGDVDVLIILFDQAVSRSYALLGVFRVLQEVLLDSSH